MPKLCCRLSKSILRLTELCVLPLLLTAGACRGQQPDAELVAAVDSMLPKLEALSGLKKMKDVALSEQTRAELRKYIEQRLAEEMPPAEMEGVRETYAALGLIPDTLNLNALLLDLYQEQVAGYYDPKSNEFYVIKGTPVSLLRPVLAHELVHALQDQHSDLDSLISRSRGNDRQTAAQAAIEGHATVVMFALMIEEATGGNVTPEMLPDVSKQLAPALAAQNAQFPVFRRAPRIVRETMIFPYVGGAEFVRDLWLAEKRFVAPLDSLLPQSTEQVLHPREKFIVRRDRPVELRFADQQAFTYENTLGELEIGIFLAEHLGSSKAASGWAGDRYRLLKNGMLMWQTLWDSQASADRFADAYRQVGAKRRMRGVRVERNKVAGHEGVLVFDAPAGVAVKSAKAPALRLVE